MTYFRYIGTQTIFETQKRVARVINAERARQRRKTKKKKRKKNNNKLQQKHPIKIPVTHLAKTTILITHMI